MRPQLFAYPLFALALFLLYRWQAGEKKAVYWLPLISLLWVNLHGSFVMLVLLVGAALVYLGRGDRRALALAFAGVLLATLVNPRGFGAWTYVFNSLTVQSSQQFSAEWRPPVNTGWQMNLFFLWLLGFPLLAALSPRKLDRLEWAWFLGFGFLALWGERYVIWFVFILVVLTACLLADWEKKYLERGEVRPPSAQPDLGLVFLLLPLAFLPGLREQLVEASAACHREHACRRDRVAGCPPRPARSAVERDRLLQLPRICPAAAPHLDRHALRGLPGGTMAAVQEHHLCPL